VLGQLFTRALALTTIIRADAWLLAATVSAIALTSLAFVGSRHRWPTVAAPLRNAGWCVVAGIVLYLVIFHGAQAQEFVYAQF